MFPKTGACFIDDFVFIITYITYITSSPRVTEMYTSHNWTADQLLIHVVFLGFLRQRLMFHAQNGCFSCDDPFLGIFPLHFEGKLLPPACFSDHLREIERSSETPEQELKIPNVDHHEIYFLSEFIF
jgi:hypothetical protein